jgi:hypothetical protein
MTEYTFLAIIEGMTADGRPNQKNFSCLDANLNATFDKATKTIHVTGTMLCENWDDATDRPLFTVDITAAVSAPYSHDNNETDFAESFPTYSLITDDSDQGVIYVDARNENDAVAALEFWVEENATTLAPGTYPINDSHQLQTVSMSEGTDDSGSILYSFVGHVYEQRILSDVWFLVSGTVTVSESGVITVEGLNSNGKTVKCVLGDTSTGITTVGAQSQSGSVLKHLENGRLVITKNGHRYNGMGVEMK